MRGYLYRVISLEVAVKDICGAFLLPDRGVYANSESKKRSIYVWWR
jgi:hypothetical protein